MMTRNSSRTRTTRTERARLCRRGNTGSVELAYISLNQELIGKAISLCKNSFWWKFCTLDTQIGMISKVYDKLKKLQDS